MKGTFVLTIATVLVGASIGLATPPGPSARFDCTDGGSTSCATDDTGCVSNTAAHLKCSSALGKAFAKAVASVVRCHAKQAQMRFQGSSVTGAGTSEENCEDNPGNSAQGKLDATIAKLASSGLCDPLQLAGAAQEESDLFGSGATSLDEQNGDVFCDSSSGAMVIGDDDAGFVAKTADNLKCELTVGKMVSRLVAAVAKCHDKMNKAFFKARDFDEKACEETNPSSAGALDKYDHQRDKLALLGICPSCLDSTHIDALGASILAQLESANQRFYPCNLGQ